MVSSSDLMCHTFGSLSGVILQLWNVQVMRIQTATLKWQKRGTVNVIVEQLHFKVCLNNLSFWVTVYLYSVADTKMAQSAPLILRLVASSITAVNRAGKIIRDIMSEGDLGIVEKVRLPSLAGITVWLPEHWEYWSDNYKPVTSVIIERINGRTRSFIFTLDKCNICSYQFAWKFEVVSLLCKFVVSSQLQNRVAQWFSDIQMLNYVITWCNMCQLDRIASCCTVTSV